MNDKTNYTNQGWDLPPTAIVKLHARDLDAGGSPRMIEAFVNHLEDACSSTTSSAETMEVLTLGAAWGKLATEFPTLATCVSLRYVEQPRQTVRAAAATLGVSVRAVHVRAWAGLGQMALWCGTPAEDIKVALRHLPQDVTYSRNGGLS